METREYFEEVMQDYNQKRNGRSLRKYSLLLEEEDPKQMTPSIRGRAERGSLNSQNQAKLVPK